VTRSGQVITRDRARPPRLLTRALTTWLTASTLAMLADGLL